MNKYEIGDYIKLKEDELDRLGYSYVPGETYKIVDAIHGDLMDYYCVNLQVINNRIIKLHENTGIAVSNYYILGKVQNPTENNQRDSVENIL